MDLANAGVAKSVIAAPITPTFRVCLFPNMANSPFLSYSGLSVASTFKMHTQCQAAKIVQQMLNRLIILDFLSSKFS
jgi:hypothetical protein